MADQLRGWKEISNHLGVSERTAQRWGQELHLPVHRVRRDRSGPVFADVEELERWRQSADGVRAEAERTDAPDPTSANGQTATSTDAATLLPRLLAWPRRHLVVAWAAAGLMVGVVALALLPLPWYRVAAPPPDTVLPAVLPVDAKAVPSGTSLFTLRVTFDANSVFEFREPEGGAAIVTTADGSKFGVAPVAGGPGRLKIHLAKIVRDPKGSDRINVLGLVDVPRGSAVPVVYQGQTLFRLQWLTSTPVSTLASSPTDPPPQCCITCAGRITVCAAEVSSVCGTCCGFGFEQCSKKAAPSHP